MAKDKLIILHSIFKLKEREAKTNNKMPWRAFLLIITVTHVLLFQ